MPASRSASSGMLFQRNSASRDASMAPSSWLPVAADRRVLGHAVIQQELGAAQDSREAHLDAGLEVAAVVAAARVELAQGLAILIVERPAVGAQREAAEDLVGARGIAHGIARPAREDGSARRRIAGPRRIVRSRDERARDDRPAIAVVADRQVRSVRIEQLLLEREALRDERDADAMQPGAHAQAHRQPRRHLHHRAADVAVRERVVLDTAELRRSERRRRRAGSAARRAP